MEDVLDIKLTPEKKLNKYYRRHFQKNGERKPMAPSEYTVGDVRFLIDTYCIGDLLKDGMTLRAACISTAGLWFYQHLTTLRDRDDFVVIDQYLRNCENVFLKKVSKAFIKKIDGGDMTAISMGLKRLVPEYNEKHTVSVDVQHTHSIDGAALDKAYTAFIEESRKRIAEPVKVDAEVIEG